VVILELVTIIKCIVLNIMINDIIIICDMQIINIISLDLILYIL